jgi:hypothetical protein
MAKKILGVKTETEALDGALDMLIYREAMARGTEEMEGEEYVDVLGIAAEIPAEGKERYNNCLLAATAGNHGCVIVTHNREDFDLIGRVESLVSSASRLTTLDSRLRGNDGTGFLAAERTSNRASAPLAGAPFFAPSRPSR